MNRSLSFTGAKILRPVDFINLLAQKWKVWLALDLGERLRIIWVRNVWHSDSFKHPFNQILSALGS